MADRVSASITIGGTVSAADYSELVLIIQREGLSIEWDGEEFVPEHRTLAEPLALCAHEVAWGRFEELERWCIDHGLPFTRWSGGYGAEWGPERLVFKGNGEPVSYAADEEDRIVISRETAETLGSIKAINAHFDAADWQVPPLLVGLVACVEQGHG